MTIPARLIRNIPGPHRKLSSHDQDRNDLILAGGRTAMAHYGSNQIAMSEFALALRLEPRQTRRLPRHIRRRIAAKLRMRKEPE